MKFETNLNKEVKEVKEMHFTHAIAATPEIAALLKEEVFDRIASFIQDKKDKDLFKTHYQLENNILYCDPRHTDIPQTLQQFITVALRYRQVDINNYGIIINEDGQTTQSQFIIYNYDEETDSYVQLENNGTPVNNLTPVSNKNIFRKVVETKDLESFMDIYAKYNGLMAASFDYMDKAEVIILNIPEETVKSLEKQYKDEVLVKAGVKVVSKGVKTLTTAAATVRREGKEVAKETGKLATEIVGSVAVLAKSAFDGAYTHGVQILHEEIKNHKSDLEIKRANAQLKEAWAMITNKKSKDNMNNITLS